MLRRLIETTGDKRKSLAHARNDVNDRLCCKSRRHLIRSPKMGNIRIRRGEFLNQNSLFGLDLEKVFFAPGPKIVLQHYRPKAALTTIWFLAKIPGHPDHQLPISSAIINAQIAVASALTPFQPQLSSASRSRRAWYADRSPIPRRSEPPRLHRPS